jgi:tetratricopeptide (TPR) repeat protein
MVVLVIPVKISYTLGIMKNISVLFSFFFLFLGCKQASVVSSQTQVVQETGSALSEDDQLKFDYLFQQALRERLSGNLEAAFKLYGECRQIDNNSAVVLYEMGSIFMMTGQFDAARVYLEGAVKLAPTNFYYKESLVNVYFQLKDIPSAIKVYEDIVSKNPDNEDKLYVLSRLYTSNNQLDKAIELLDRLQNLMGIVEEFSITKSDLYYSLGNKKKSLAELETFRKKFPSVPSGYAAFGSYYERDKQYSKALQFYKQANEVAGNNGLFLDDIARVYLVLGDTSNFKSTVNEAISSVFLTGFEKVSILVRFLDDKDLEPLAKPFMQDFFVLLESCEPKDADVLSFLAINYQFLDNLDKASELFVRSMDEMLDSEKYWIAGLRLFLTRSEFDLLDVYGKQATMFFRENPFIKFLYSIALQQLKKENEAIVVLEQADSLLQENDSFKGQILSSLGDNYYAVGDPEKAFSYYEKALAINPNEPMTLNNYAYYLSVLGRDLDKAEKMSQKCIQLEPSNATYLDTHAWVLFKLGRFFEAKFIMERALDYDKDPSSVLFDHYGDILYFNQNVEGAIAQWEKALLLDPDSEIIMRKIESKQYIDENAK